MGTWETSKVNFDVGMKSEVGESVSLSLKKWIPGDWLDGWTEKEKDNFGRLFLVHRSS